MRTLSFDLPQMIFSKIELLTSTNHVHNQIGTVQPGDTVRKAVCDVGKSQRADHDVLLLGAQRGMPVQRV